MISIRNSRTTGSQTLARILIFTFVMAFSATIVVAQGASPTGPSEVGRQAIDALQAGNLARVVELLEPLRDHAETSPMELALLGAVYVELGRPADALEVLTPLAQVGEADAAVLFNAGRAELAMGDQAKAAAYFGRSVALQPISPAARELGLLRGRQGKTGEAYRLLRPWALRNPDDSEARAAAAACALTLDRPSEVDALLEGLPTNDPRIALLRGQLLAQRGKPAEALEVLEPFLENHPPEMTADLLPLIGDLYIQLGRAADAATLLGGRPGIPPRAALVLADALYRTGELDKAVDALAPFAEIIEKGEAEGRMRPGTISMISLDYGRMLVASSRHEEAVPHLERATQSSPSNQLAWKSLGDALIGVGRREEAKVALQRFRDLSQSQTERRQRAEAAASDPVIQALLAAQKAMDEGKNDQALVILRQEVALSPGDLRPRISEVRVLLGLERFDEAGVAAQAALTAFPNQPDALYLVGSVFMAQQKPGDAEQVFRRVISVMPEHVAALNDLAVVLIARGERREAREILNRVLEIRPEDEMAQANLTRLAG